MPRAGSPSPRLAAAAAFIFLALRALLARAAARAGADITVGNAQVHIDFDPGSFGAGGDAIREWIERSAGIVSGYYGRFPPPRLPGRVIDQTGAGVQGAQTCANPDAFIRVRVGEDVSRAQLLSDWMMVHEMSHLALPDTGEVHAWLSEGLGNYVEGEGRVKASNRPATAL